MQYVALRMRHMAALKRNFLSIYSRPVDPCHQLSHPFRQQTVIRRLRIRDNFGVGLFLSSVGLCVNLRHTSCDKYIVSGKNRPQYCLQHDHAPFTGPASVPVSRTAALPATPIPCSFIDQTALHGTGVAGKCCSAVSGDVTALPVLA